MKWPSSARKTRLEELRSLLAKPLDINELADKLSDAVEIARANTHLAKELEPIVETSMMRAIQKNPRGIAEIFFPIILPAIRKAVKASLSALVDEVNRVLEKALSLEALHWRWESFRSGQPIAEIALKHSFRNRIQDILLVHRKTGILLLRSTISPELATNPELTSSMLMSIQDFLHNSFELSGEHELTRLDIGNFTTWIEQGPQAILVARLEGPITSEFRDLMGETLAKIHENGNSDLAHFLGDVVPFSRFQELLNGCLNFTPKNKKKAKGIRRVAWTIVLFPALILLAYLAFYSFRHWQENRVLDEIRALPGVTRTEIEHSGFRSMITVWLDTSSPSTNTKFDDIKSRANGMNFRMIPVVSSDPRLLEEKANSLNRTIIYFPLGQHALTERASRVILSMVPRLRNLEQRAMETGYRTYFTVMADADWELGTARRNAQLIELRARELARALRSFGFNAEINGTWPRETLPTPALRRRAGLFVEIKRLDTTPIGL